MKSDSLRVVVVVLGLAHAGVTVLQARSTTADAKLGPWRSVHRRKEVGAAEASQSNARVFDQMMADIESLEPYIDRQIERKLNITADDGSGYTSYLKCLADSQKKISARRKAYATVFKTCVEDCNRKATEVIQIAKERVVSPSPEEPVSVDSVASSAQGCSPPSCKAAAATAMRNLYGTFDVNADFQLNKARLAVDVNDNAIDSCMEGIIKAVNYLNSYQEFLREMCSSLRGGRPLGDRSADRLPPLLVEF